MNNLQYIVKNDTRAAMHMAVELCERGDFDSVTEAFRWLNQETVGNYTRWHELFGTPERAARTLQDMCNGSENCKDLRCPALQDTEAQCGNYKLLLEWLRGDAE